METKEQQCDGNISLNFRGTVIQFDRNLLSKLPRSSEFNQYLQTKYSLNLSDLEQAKSSGSGINIMVSRNPAMFHHILDYLEQRHLHFPHCICLNVILDELQFWGITTCQLASCCLDRLFIEQEEKLKKDRIEHVWENISQKKEQLTHLKTDNCKCDVKKKSGKTQLNNGKVSHHDVTINHEEKPSNKVIGSADTIRHILTDPSSSFTAKLWAGAMGLVIIASILLLSLETEPMARQPQLEEVMSDCNKTKGQGLYRYYIQHTMPVSWILYIDVILTAILTVDFIGRMTLSRNKFHFLKLPLSVLDILGLLPVWIIFIIFIILRSESEKNVQNPEGLIRYAYYFSSVRVVRIFRLGHLILHNKKLRIVVVALKCSWNEMLVLFTVVLVIAMLFGLFMYYIAIWVEDTFLTLFEAQWWALITMATVGYGDFYPKSSAGRAVGVLCCLCGIVTVAMSTSIFVNNFIYIYRCVDKIDRMSRIRLLKNKGSGGNTPACLLSQSHQKEPKIT